MKRISRILGVFLCLAMVISANAFAADHKTIDVSTTSEGYFTVHYEADADLKMKVGVATRGDTIYYDYVPGEETSYSLTKGNGQYTITLYRNVKGTSYKKVVSQRVTVKMEDSLAPYLASVSEVMFAPEDEVSKKAAELCEGISDDAGKIVAIHNYIAENFKYDYVFAAAVRSGRITSYMPNTNEALAKQRGVCYDFSAVFAAMCRSQGIPCAIAKGYISNGYHAWNMVYLNDEWIAVDLTAAIAYRRYQAADLEHCVVSLDSYYDYSF